MTPRPFDATELGRGRSRLARSSVAFALLSITTLTSHAVAQSAVPTTRNGTPVSSAPANGVKDAGDSGPTASAASGQPVFGLLRAEDGAVVPLPVGTRYEDFLSWIAARRGPGYGINSVRLTGSVGADGRAELDAEVVLVVHRDEEWVRVPLAFGEATLVGFEHTGVGHISFESFAKEVGHTWSLQGRGEHRLQLKLLVPLTERSGETRLVLSTPANAATTKLNLTIPSDPTVSAVGGVVRSNFTSDQQTSLEWLGPGGRIDLSWRPQVAAAQPADLAASTVIIPSLTGKTVQLRAVQKITPSRGQVASIKTRLPAGFVLESVSGSLYQSHSEETTESGKVVTVQLVEATGSTFELTYRVTAPLPTDGTFAVDGFSLLDVPPQAQSGRIQLERSTGYDVRPVDGSEGIEKIEMLEPMPLTLSSAYAFNAQPFHLALKAEPISPALAVTPTLQFHVLPERIDLDAEFAVEVRKGELREVRLNWPGSRWSVSPIRAGPIQEFPRTPEAGGPIEIGVPGTTPTFTIPVRASLARDAGSEQIVVRLPKIDGTPRQKAEVVTDPIHIELESPLGLAIAVSSGGTVLEPLNTSLPTTLIDGESSSRTTSYVVPAETVELVFDVRKLERQVHTTARLSLSSRGDKLHVEEQIDYDVQNEPLSSLRLSIPNSLLAQNLQFVDQENRPLTFTVEERHEDASDVIIPLSSPFVGAFAISTKYDLARGVAVGDAGNVRVPVVQPADATRSQTALMVSPMRRHHVNVVDAEWVRVQSTESKPQELWLGSGASQSIRLALVPRSSEESSKVVVSRLLQRSLLRRDGSVVTYTDVQFAQVPPSITVRFPQELKPDSFSCAGSPSPRFSTPMAMTRSQKSCSVTVPARRFWPSHRSRQGTVWGSRAVARYNPWSSKMRSCGRRCGSSRFPSHNTSSENLPSMNRRTSGTWMAASSGVAIRRNGSMSGSVQPSHESVRNSTLAMCTTLCELGRARPLEFASISRSLVVLIGAGTAILLGYAFANGLILHRRKALIAVASVFLLAWTVFPNQVQIFLPPAVFGLLLVAIAAVAEWLLQRRQDRLAASAQSAVDFVTILPGDGSHSGTPSAIGSEEPTVVRTVRPPEHVGSSHGSPL